MQQLSGRVAVVTGAASGIGLAMARRFCEEGMKVVLSDVEESALADATKTLESEGHRVVGVRCDVRSQQSVDELRDATLKDALGQYIAQHEGLASMEDALIAAALEIEREVDGKG